MRGPRLKTPLLLLLLLLTSLTGTALCQEDDGTEPENGVEEEGEEDPNVEPADYVTTDITATTPSLTEISDTDQADDKQEEHSSGAPIYSDEIDADGSPITTDYSNVTDWTTVPEEEEGLSPIIILIPVVLVVLIIGMIVCGIFINRRWNNKARNQELSKEDPYLDGSSTEKVPMPMFEEDVPSVLELEMEELDQWMKKDGGAEGDSKQT